MLQKMKFKYRNAYIAVFCCAFITSCSDHSRESYIEYDETYADAADGTAYQRIRMDKYISCRNKKDEIRNQCESLPKMKNHLVSQEEYNNDVASCLETRNYDLIDCGQ